MKYTNSSGVSIDFTPWFDLGFRFTKLHMVEKIGGHIPGGVVTLEHAGGDISLKCLSDVSNGEITIETKSGIRINSKIFITSKNFLKNNVELTFVCVKDKGFIYDRHSSTWDDIEDTIKSLYPGEVDIRCKSDTTSGISLVQSWETDHSFLNRLCLSYKKNTIFGYGWDKLVLKDIVGIDSLGRKEPESTLITGSDLILSDYIRKNYDHQLFKQPKNPWEEDPEFTDLQPKNFQVVVDRGDFRVVRKKYRPLVDNYLYNRRLMETNLFTSIIGKGKVIPQYRLGDTISYVGIDKMYGLENFPYKTFLVSSNEFFISTPESSRAVDSHGLANLSWTTKLIGLEEGGKLLPEEENQQNSK